jgi:hypothetical protein
MAEHIQKQQKIASEGMDNEGNWTTVAKQRHKAHAEGQTGAKLSTRNASTANSPKKGGHSKKLSGHQKQQSAPTKKLKSPLQLAQEAAAIGKPLTAAEWEKLTNFSTSSEATLSLSDGPDPQLDDQPAPIGQVMNDTLHDMSAIAEDEYKLATQMEELATQAAAAMDVQADKKRKNVDEHAVARQDNNEDDEDMEMDEDEKADKFQTQLPLPMRDNRARYDITLEVAPSDNPVQAVATQFMKVYQALLSVDNSTIIYPWSMADVEHVGYYLQSLDQLGKTTTAIEPYLNGFQNVTNFPNTKSGSQFSWDINAPIKNRPDTGRSIAGSVGL